MFSPTYNICHKITGGGKFYLTLVAIQSRITILYFFFNAWSHLYNLNTHYYMPTNKPKQKACKYVWVLPTCHLLSPPSTPLPLVMSMTGCLISISQITVLDNEGHSSFLSCNEENKTRHLQKMLKSYAKNTSQWLKDISAKFLNNKVLLNNIT